jgi:hypothetical protein
MKVGFLPLVLVRAAAFFTGAFLTITFFLGKAFLTLDFVAIEISFDIVLLLMIKTLEGNAQLPFVPCYLTLSHVSK